MELSKIVRSAPYETVNVSGNPEAIEAVPVTDLRAHHGLILGMQ